MNNKLKNRLKDINELECMHLKIAMDFVEEFFTQTNNLTYTTII